MSRSHIITDQALTPISLKLLSNYNVWSSPALMAGEDRNYFSSTFLFTFAIPSYYAIMRNINEKIVAHCCALLFEVYHNRYAQLQKLSESALVVLNCFKSSPEKRLKASDIQKDTRLPRRTVQYTLQTLPKKAFIQKLGKGAGTRYQLIF